MADTWNEAIIEAMRNTKQRVVSLQTIYEQMKLHPLVTPYHKQEWTPDGQLRYENQIRRCLTDLVKEQRVKRVGRGKYSLI